MGAFRLGLVPPTPNDQGEVKKWSELSMSGKGASQCCCLCTKGGACKTDAMCSGRPSGPDDSKDDEPPRDLIRGRFLSDARLRVDFGALLEKLGDGALRPGL